ETQRRTLLLRYRLAVGAGDEESELIACFGDRETLDIGPWVPGLALARRDRGIEESLHAQVLRRRQRLRQFQQLRQGKAAPWNRHRPSFDTTVAVKPLLKRHLADQVVEADLLGLLHHAIHLDRPRPQLEGLRSL